MRLVGLILLGRSFLFSQPASTHKTLIDQTFGIDSDSGWIHIMKGLPDNFELEKTRTNGLMYTNKEYSRYVIRWEYKWGSKKMNQFSQWQYDAGVWIHCITDNIWPKALEFQIRFDHIKNEHYTGQIVSTIKGNWYSKNNRFAFPEDGGVKKPFIVWDGLQGKEGVNTYGLGNQWTKCEIVVMKNKYALMKVNDKIINYVTDITDPDGKPVTKGKIAFQSETAEIFYRNLEIAELDTIMSLDQAKSGNYTVVSLDKSKSQMFQPLQRSNPLKISIAGNQVHFSIL